MKHVALIILLITFSLLTLSCEEYFGEKIWAYYNETGCNTNPWGHADRDKTEPTVVRFLEEKNIPVFDIRIELYSTGPMCMACICPTGRRIHVLIMESDIKEIKNLGFHL